MKLVRPSVVFKDSYLAAAREEEIPKAGLNGDGVNLSLMHTDFAAYVESLNDRAKGIGLPPGYVEDSVFWLVEGAEYIGRTSIRHRLNEHLINVGGHIGYVIRPTMRGKGCGTKILAFALLEAKKLGLEKVLLTCNETNVGSRKIIEKNGGVLEDTRPNPDGGPDKRRYWIQL